METRPGRKSFPGIRAAGPPLLKLRCHDNAKYAIHSELGERPGLYTEKLLEILAADFALVEPLAVSLLDALHHAALSVVLHKLSKGALFRPGWVVVAQLPDLVVYENVRNA